MKKRNLFICLLCLLVLTFSIYSQEGNSKQEKNQKGEYEELLKKLKAGDASIDFKALRIAYTDTDDYTPLGCKDGRDELFKAFNEKKYKEAVKFAEKVMETCYIEMNAHYIASISHSELKNQEKSEFHKKVYLNLVKSIITDGDGKSAKTAWTVISVDEEYAVLSALGFRRTVQSLINENGSKYDVLEAFNIENKEETAKFYFNVDIVFKGYSKMFDEKK